jgi:kinesin family member 6/9
VWVLCIRLHVVDLAGSERVNKTMSTGSIQKEANYINKSLSYLEQVVIALAQTNRDHIPFRQSKLTYLLKDSLGGNCNTYLIACIWPKRDHSWETLSTLRFAARMKTIETHPVRNRLVAKEQAPSRVMQQQVDALKKELAMRDSMAGRESWLPELTKPQKLWTCKQCVDFSTRKPIVKDGDASSRAASLTINSISQMQLMLDLMKLALWDACDGNEELVRKSIQNVLVDENLLSVNRINKVMSVDPVVSSEKVQYPIGNEIDTESVALTGRNGTEADERESEPILYKSREEYLQEFTVGPGRALNESFEQIKETLKCNKTRQREIVSLLNEQKQIIDDLTSQLISMSEEELELPGVDILKEKLDSAKKSYRAAHHELQICKEQVNETQSLKKRAMTTMLSAFNDYITSIGADIP